MGLGADLLVAGTLDGTLPTGKPVLLNHYCRWPVPDLSFTLLACLFLLVVTNVK